MANPGSTYSTTPVRRKPPAAGMGRRKGVPNKATANAREAIARLVDENTTRLQGWLDEIAEEQGAKAAWQCFMEVVEYHIPKLSRAEVTGAGGGPLTVKVVKFGEESPSG